MQALIGGGKYRVMEVLYSDPDLDVCLCSEITVNRSEQVIINSFKDHAAIRALLPVLYEMKKGNPPRDFRELITADGCISVIFRRHAGAALGEYPKGGANQKYEERLAAADRLLSSALELDLLDDRIAERVLSVRNAFIDLTGKTAGFHYMMLPDPAADPDFRGKRLGVILRMMFPPDRYLPEEIECLIGELLDGKYSGCAAVYTRWREIQGSAAETREKYLKENLAEYLLRKIKTAKGKADNHAKSGGRRT